MCRTHTPLTKDESVLVTVKHKRMHINANDTDTQNKNLDRYNMTGSVMSQNNSSALNKQDDVASTWYKTSTDYPSAYTPQSSRLSKGPHCSISIHPHA